MNINSTSTSVSAAITSENFPSNSINISLSQDIARISQIKLNVCTFVS